MIKSAFLSLASRWKERKLGALSLVIILRIILRILEFPRNYAYRLSPRCKKINAHQYSTKMVRQWDRHNNHNSYSEISKEKPDLYKCKYFQDFFFYAIIADERAGNSCPNARWRLICARTAAKFTSPVIGRKGRGGGGGVARGNIP